MLRSCVCCHTIVDTPSHKRNVFTYSTRSQLYQISEKRLSQEVHDLYQSSRSPQINTTLGKGRCSIGESSLHDEDHDSLQCRPQLHNLCAQYEAHDFNIDSRSNWKEFPVCFSETLPFHRPCLIHDGCIP